MPQLEWNKDTWDGGYDWSGAGDEWSSAWGGPVMQWHWVLFPRLRAFLPADSVLEIAPGFGRWTQFLAANAKQLTVVDYAEKCIAACKARFADKSHIAYHVNDGRTLPMVPFGSINFAFSFDSLVHVDWSILDSYLTELAGKLKPDGVAIIHHSNLGELFPNPGDRRSLETKWHHRATDVSAVKVESRLQQLGMQVINQELVNWGTAELIDCFTTFTPRTSAKARPNRVLRNPDFMAEADHVRKLAANYGE